MAEMTQRSAPAGTVATLGHPANKVLVVKALDGNWYSLHDLRKIHFEEFRAGWDLYDPHKETSDGSSTA